MRNQVALVTGGMGGIGTAICRSLIDQGAKVVATYNRGGDHVSAQKWQRQQKENGYHVDIAFVDVTDYNSCSRLIKGLPLELNKIDILINNAGVTYDAQCYKMALDAWHKVVNTNLNGTFYVTRHVINGMIERQYGRIINISSVNGQKGQFGQVNYSASKAGIHGLTKALALEVASKGITVNTISPGYVATDMVMSVPEAVREQILAQIPVKRFGQPEEIARAVVFLAAPESSFITGSNLSINGGQYQS